MTAPGAEFGYHELERCALAFVLEDEAWPVFLAWAAAHHVTSALHDWLAAGPDLERYRGEFLAHSPEFYWRAVAEQMRPPEPSEP